MMATLTDTREAHALGTAHSRHEVGRKVGSRVALWAFVGVLAFLVLMPLVRLQWLAIEDGGRGYVTAFTSSRIGKVIATTGMLTVGSVAIAMVLGVLLAYWAMRLPRGLRWLRMLPILPIVLPPLASIVGWAFLLSPQSGLLNAGLRRLMWWSDATTGPLDVYTVPSIIVIVGLNMSSFVYLFVSAGFSNIGSELVEASYVSGSRNIGTFFRVILPLLRPSLIYGASVAILLTLGQFTAPLLLGTNEGIAVIPTEMYASIGGIYADYGAAAAYGSPLLIVAIIIAVGQRVALGDGKRFVTHGGKAFSSQWSSSSGAAAGISIFFVISTGLPLVALLLLALSPSWSAAMSPSSFTLDNFDAVFSRPDISEAVWNSVYTSCLAVLIVLPIGLIAASILRAGTGGSVVRRILGFTVDAPLAIPAVLFGAGFLMTYTSPPLVLYGSQSILLIVYVTLMLPFATRMASTALTSLGTMYEEASYTSGAGPLRTKVLIVAPLMRPAISGAAALIFVMLSHEFTASVLVRAPFQQVMGTILYDYWLNGGYPTVAAIALIMSAVTAVGVFVALLLGGTNSLEKL